MCDGPGGRCACGSGIGGARAFALVAAWVIGPGAWACRAQDRAVDLAEKPILVLDTGGHHAPIRRLVFTPDGKRLLSAGQDKVVRVWNLPPVGPALAWTIRPPIWRGSAGVINAMALTGGEEGPWTLALAGQGLQATRGDIGLYRFPGAPDRRRGGDVEGYLTAPEVVPLPQSKGHLDTVTSLAFSPTRPILASSSNDGTVRLWDHRARSQVALLAPAEAKPSAVNALAFTRDGRRLVSGGKDGFLRVWDVAAPVPGLLAQVPPKVNEKTRDDPDGLAINTLDVDPSGRWVVLGREDGSLLRYDLRASPIADSAAIFKTGPDQGPVEGLAIGPDGRVATSIISRRAATADRPTVQCDIEIWRVDNLAKTANVARTSNLVYALAWNPAGTSLAFAGGDRQEIFLYDVRAEPRQIANLAGPSSRGMSVWDVGFAGNQELAYSYTQPGAPPPAAYFGFNLKTRSRQDYASAQVSRAIETFEGWSVRPASPYLLDVVRGGRVEFQIRLAPQYDGRWWSHSFLPPGPKHEGPTLAVACDRGVAVYRLSDHVRTRFLDGHSGPVYRVAPSPDGKWLASGSSDQTIRLWTLAGIDQLAPLGATFALDGGVLSVKEVVRGSFAARDGFRVGDLVDVPALGGKAVGIADFLKAYASSPPNVQVAYSGRRPRPGAAPEVVKVGTTKRDRPSLSLFVGLDGEWILWMPRGFYDSSVIGDSKLLGWQVNRYSLDRPSPTDSYKIVTNEKALRQPGSVPGNVIERVLDLGDESTLPDQDAGEQVAAVQDNRPPRVWAMVGEGGAPLRTLEGQPIAVGSPLPESFAMSAGTLAIRWVIEPWPGKPVGRFAVRLAGQAIGAPQVPPLDPGLVTASVPSRLDLEIPGEHGLVGVADLGTGSERRAVFKVKVDAPPPPQPNQLRILAIAPTFLAPRPLPIRGSEQDAKDLTEFFAGHAVDDSARVFPAPGPPDRGLVGKGGTTDAIEAALKRLAQEKVKPGDMVIVIVETYVLTKELESRLVVANSRGTPPTPETTLSTEVVNKALEPLVRAGCKVVLVLDGARETSGWMADSTNATEWARILRNQYDVTTVLANTRRTNRVADVRINRPLAEAILRTVEEPGDRPMTLARFHSSIKDRVQQVTRFLEEPAVYIPDAIDEGSPFLDLKPGAKR